MPEKESKRININFQKLTPHKNIDLGIYKDALDFVFTDPDIKNIAISGSYGAGKSSLIETYKTVSKNKFINISLAHFENEAKGRQEVSPNNLEGKIINQLVHQIRATDIPLTRFKIKENPSKGKSFTYTMIVVLTMFFLLINFRYANWLDMITTIYDETQWNWLPFMQSGIFQLITIVFILFFSIYIVYYFITVQKNKLTIKKAVAKDFEIEVFEDADSYFDKHLNEVLYLFENSRANTIVFEDMDRFDDNSIFEKLREINTLINNRLGKTKSFEIFVLNKINTRLRSRFMKFGVYDQDGVIIEEVVNTMSNKDRRYLKIFNFINNRLNKKTKPIKFVYLLRDDVFISKERTKFFDFILPVIPVVDSTNSYDKFIDKFRVAGILEKFDQTFLHDISLYVDDYRILKNIHNEFLNYHEKLEVKKHKLKYNQLLSMIIYKNIFPKDFADLQLNKGYVREIFNNKQKILDKEVETKRMAMPIINDKIQQISNEFLDNIDELDTVFFKIPPNIKINGKVIDNTYTPLQIIKEIKENDYKIEIGEYTPGYYRLEMVYKETDIRNDFNKLMNIDEYKKRYELTNANKKSEIKVLEEQKTEIEKEINNINNKSLHMIITRKNKKNIFNVKSLKKINNVEIDQYNYIKESDYYNLLVYLITNGYIDENGYTDYMSFFYPNSISRNDKLFLKSIIDQEALQFEYSLDSPSKVAERIRVSSFREIETLNFDLLTYLLSKSANEDEGLNIYLSTIIEKCQVGDEMHRYIDFLTRYFDSMVNVDILAKTILKNNQFIDYITSTTKINLMHKEKIIMLSLIFTELTYSERVQDFISNSNYFMVNETVTIKHNYFTTDVNNVSDKFVSVEEETTIVDILCTRFNDNNIKFRAIDHDIINHSFMSKIYENNNYVISLSHIYLMLEYFYKIPISKDYQIKNYSLIFSDKNQYLYKYINEKNNINKYIGIITRDINEKLCDEENAFIDIINNCDVEKATKISYIQKSDTVITDLQSVDSYEFKTELLKNNNVKFAQENILDYYKYDCEEDSSINNVLVDFINNQSELLIIDFNWITEKEGKEVRDKLLRGFIRNNNLENRHYNSLFKNTTWHFPSFSFTGINDDKIDILITTNTLKMNKQTLTCMRENYSNNLKYYILNAPNEYVEIINEENFVYEELLWVLESKEIEENLKIELLKCTDEKVTYSNEYSDDVKQYILNNNFDTDDLGIICESYPNEFKDIKVNIERLIIEYIDDVIDRKLSIGIELLCNIYIGNSLNKGDKLSIFNNSIMDLNIQEIKKVLTLIKVENYYLVLDNKRPLISKNAVNKSILEKLKKKKVVSSFPEDINNEDCYRVYPYQKLWDKLK